MSRIVYSSWGMMVALMAALAAQGCGEDDGPNRPPAITAVQSDLMEVMVGETVTLTADASDPDGDELIYVWSAALGEFEQALGPQAVWKAPATPGIMGLSVTVEDTRGGVDERTLTVSVLPDEGPPSIGMVPVADGQPAEEDVNVEATITDPGGVKLASLFFRSLGTAVYMVRVMVEGEDGRYQGTIPGSSVTSRTMEYYITAEDMAGNEAAFPEGAPEEGPLAFLVEGLADLAAPVIDHQPVANGQLAGEPVDVVAQVTDENELDMVTLWYSDDGIFVSVLMVEEEEGFYRARILGEAVLAPQGAYYIEASDATGNRATDPAGAPSRALHYFDIEER